MLIELKSVHEGLRGKCVEGSGNLSGWILLEVWDEALKLSKQGSTTTRIFQGHKDNA